MRIVIAVFLLSVTLTAAMAFNFGGEGNQYGHMGAFPKAGTGNGPGCTNGSLVFTTACNSQYLTVLH